VGGKKKKLLVKSHMNVIAGKKSRGEELMIVSKVT
jgi:hypothetical protein